MNITYRLGELFCGPGGIALGAKWASTITNPTNSLITHAWATDYDKDTCRTYSLNICGVENSKSVIHDDIRKRGNVTPKTNVDYWQKKRFRNVERDKENLRTLKNQSWKVLVIWECQVKNSLALENNVKDFLYE